MHRSIIRYLKQIIILYRQTPFASGPNDTPTEILHRIAGSKLDLRCGTWVTISNEAKVSHFFLSFYPVISCIRNFFTLSYFQDLVCSMLHVEPRRRPTTSQIMQHPWITRRDNLPTNRIHLPEPNLIRVSIYIVNECVDPNE